MRRPRALLLAVVMTVSLLPAVAAPTAAQENGDGTVVPLQVTGPPGEKLNLIVLGDGYTAEELGLYRQHVDKHLNVLWSIEPFRSYRDYFNVYMIEVVSNDSGISCDPDDGNVQRDTALNLGYARTCPADPLARGITFGPGGQQALNEYVSQIPGVTPQNRQTLSIANTDTYGGIGGRNATTSGGSPQGPLITPHELGHSLGELQDEYPYSNREIPGGPYTGGEPRSIHHTLMTDQEMLAQQAKWWRWLGEESLSGGEIRAAGPDGYESGMYRSEGIWRPSEHSIMRWIGFYFDQVGRERMTEKISGRRDVEAMAISSTPTDEAVGLTDVLWVETPHPTYHELDVTWMVDGEVVEGTGNARHLDLEALGVDAGDTVSVTVVDPTEFVRDPELRDSPIFTATREWTVGAEPSAPADVEVAFTASTETSQAVGREDVVFVETTHPTDRVLEVTWALEGDVVEGTGNRRNLDLGALDLDDGTYELTATVTDPADPEADGDTRTWTVDATDPVTTADLSEPLAVIQRPGQPDHYVYNEQFTMGLEPTDDQPGYVVAEFRLDEDGWFNYFGWPDAPEGTPFLFTPTGTTIKALTYGNLGSGGLSLAGFEDPEPGYGTHLVEYRGIDAAGNIADAEAFTATVLPGPIACDRTVTGSVRGPLRVSSGVTCLDGATVRGPVVVAAGASLVATGATITGPVVAGDADSVQLFDTAVGSAVRIADATGSVAVIGSSVDGPFVLTGSDGPHLPPIVADSTFGGPVTCSGNVGDPDDLGAANDLQRLRGLRQCGAL